MEVDQGILEGQARLLDVPTDALKDFVTKFNAAALADGLNADFTDTRRVDATSLELQWTSGSLKGVVRYDMESQSFTVVR